MLHSHLLADWFPERKRRMAAVYCVPMSMVISLNHKFCYVAATSTCSSGGILAATTNSTNKTSKADSTCH
jgi:hypothetical protein